ncbi:MAG TPA: efflux RND transporter periplasmic adaptor subunit [Kiritimatiellia bacterium]|jgi:RND family efflux transporter MFP subunit|nr:efflux RND transporter periplasmic adaptor subunit [Kiritimatiellia bacterium]HRU19463.1 efflux RND transporter periplasmic adaptor subunit [Kiritimatiellia bacterium]
MKTFAKLLLSLVVGIAIVAGARLAYQAAVRKAHPPASGKGQPSLPVRIAEVRTGNVTNAIRLTGSLEATRVVDVMPKIAGRLERLALEDGTPVLEGLAVSNNQIIAVIDHRDILAQMTQARAAVESARAAVATAKVVLKDRNRERQRMEKLFAEGSTTEQQRDLAVTAYEQSVTGLAQAEAHLTHAQTAVGVLDVTLSEAFIHAPMDGVISAKSVDAGAMVNASTRIVQVMPLCELKFLIAIPGPYLHLLTTGKTVVSVRSDAVPDRVFEGLIARIHPAVDPITRTATVEVRLANELGASGEWLLRPGLYAEGQIILEVKRDVVTLSADVALRRGPRFLAFVVKDGHAETRELKIGARDGNVLEILAGLAVGEQVVIMGQHRLTDKIAVRITE